VTNEMWQVKGDEGEGEHLSLRTFRYEGELRISIAVSVLFDFTGAGVARRVDVGSVREPYRALVKSACDVVVVGGGVRRLAIFRHGEVVVDEAAPSPGGMSPLDASSPLRAGLLHGDVRRRYDESPPRLDADFPWSYFQSAPASLRVGFLDGDEGVLLQRLDDDRADVRTRLPGLRARAVLVERGERRVVPLHLDTLAIDVERGTLLVVSRGVAVFRGAAGDAHVIARVGNGEEPTLPLHVATTRSLAGAKPPPLRPGLHSPPTLLASAPLVSPDAGAPFQLAGPMGKRRPTPRDGLPFAPVPGASSPWAPPAWPAPAPVPAPAAVPVSAPLRAPAPAITSVGASPTLASEPELEEDDGFGPMTPPSPAARVAAELRELGLSEDRVQRVMQSFHAEG
jgi:hypothetical protein